MTKKPDMASKLQNHALRM